MANAAWLMGFHMSAPGFPLQQAIEGFQFGVSLNANPGPCAENFAIWPVEDDYLPSQTQFPSPDDGLLTPRSMDEVQQQDTAILPGESYPHCDLPLPDSHFPLGLNLEQAETLATQTMSRAQQQSAVAYTAENIGVEPYWETVDSDNAKGPISRDFPVIHRQMSSPSSSVSTGEESRVSFPGGSSTQPSSPSIFSDSPTQVTAPPEVSGAPAIGEDEDSPVTDRQTHSPGSPGSAATQVPSEVSSPQAHIYIDLTGEDEPHDGGIRVSLPKSQGRRKRKHSHENAQGEQRSLYKARKRSRPERKLEKDEFRLRVTTISWKREEDRKHQTSYWDGHKWSSEKFMQNPECINSMEVKVNNGNYQTLWLYKTGQTDGQDTVWEGHDGFGIYKVWLTSEDIESKFI